jgi:hypothetical protein
MKISALEDTDEIKHISRIHPMKLSSSKKTAMDVNFRLSEFSTKEKMVLDLFFPSL